MPLESDTVNTLAPGYVADTEFFRDKLSDDIRQTLVDSALTQRPSHPEDIAATTEFLASPGARQITGDNKIAKVSVVGVGMRSHVGIASKMFRTLAEEGINIQMISTSEIKISVVIDEKYLELAVRVLHKVFELDQVPA